MAGKAMDVYLNDHLGGATLGTDLAEQIRDAAEGTPLGEVMATIAAEIEEDHQTLVDLMEALDTQRNPVKQATGWLAEKASRVKFSGAMSGESDQGTFMALESLRLGVAGKKCLWIVFREIRGEVPALANVDLDRLIERAASQEETLERERVAVGARVLTESSEAPVETAPARPAP